MILKCGWASPSCQFDVEGQLNSRSLTSNVHCLPDFSPLAMQDGKSCCEFKPTLPSNIALADIFPIYIKFLKNLTDNESAISTPTLLEYLKQMEIAFTAFAK
jgi:hypothetical protein